MRDLGHAPFIEYFTEYELLTEKPTSDYKIDEYIRNEADRTNSNINWPVVYDSVETSPYYEAENPKHGPYIDEKDSIELPNPTEQGNGGINEPYQKKYYFNPQNLPYSLEQSH